MKARPDRLIGAEERLDATGHTRAEHDRSLRRVAAVNRWLGGDRALRLALEPLLPAAGTVRILDVGTGSADLPRRLERTLRRAGLVPSITAVDLHATAVRIAAERTRATRTINVARADALRLPFRDAAFDFALLTLTLHHFEGAARVAALRELARVADTVLVGELHRSWLNYFGARLLAATIWRTDPITSHDGPVSVLRAFTASELRDLAERAGLRAPRVRRRVFERLQLVARSHRWAGP